MVEREGEFFAAKVFKRLAAFTKEKYAMSALNNSCVIQFIEGLP